MASLIMSEGIFSVRFCRKPVNWLTGFQKQPSLSIYAILRNHQSNFEPVFSLHVIFLIEFLASIVLDIIIIFYVA
jgi:hypothetical protein